MVELGGRVAAGEPVDSDDRHRHQPAHTRPLPGLLKVPGGRGGELRRSLPLGRRPGGGVDDGVDPDQRVLHTAPTKPDRPM
jgi:hypothetical protein